MTQDWQQKRAFLFSHPRTASNLLIRMLSGQPDWTIEEYQFFEAFFYTRSTFAGKDYGQASQSSRQEHQSKIDDGFKKLHETLESSKKNHRHILLKEHDMFVIPVERAYGNSNSQLPALDHSSLNNGHANTNGHHHPKNETDSLKLAPPNPTIIPDSLMLTWTPIIIIRSPVLVYESWLRAEGEPYADLNSNYSKLYTTFSFQREIYDWYDHQPNGPKCLVVEADDIMSGSEVPEALCDAIGMDKSKLMLEWETGKIPKVFQGHPAAMHATYLKTIAESKGVDVSKSSKGVVMEEKKKQWEETFGLERAEILARRVEESWEDYEYLRARRIGA